MAGRISLHDFTHGLLNEWLHSREPIAISRPKVVGEIHANHHARWRWVDAHRVGNVVQELGASVPLDVVRVEVTPAKLNIEPVFVAGGAVKDVFAL